MRAVALLPFVFIVTTSAAFAQAPTRFFSDASGKFRVRAAIVDLNETTVKLRKQDGGEIEVPVDRLSAADQTFLKAQYQQYKQMAGDFTIGKKVEIFSTGAWHPGVVKNVQPGKFFISFDHYSSTWDKWVTADQLRLPVEKKNEVPVGDEQRSPGDLMREAATAAKSQSSPMPTASPVLALEDASTMPFNYQDEWISPRRFVQAIGGPQWKPLGDVDTAPSYPGVTIDLAPLGDIKSPIQFLPSPARRRALIQDDQTVVALNLEDGSLTWAIPKLPEANMTALAISDSGKRIAFGIGDAQSERCGIRIYEIDGLSAGVLWQWRQDPPSHQITPVRAAHWLTEDRIGILDDKCFAVWMPDTHTQHAVIRADANTVLELSPGGGQIALLTSKRLMLAQTDGVQIWGYSNWLPEGSSSMSFHPDGGSVLVSGGDQAARIDTVTGHTVLIDVAEAKGKSVQWIDAEFVLIDGQLVFDLQNKRPVWSFKPGGWTKAATTDVQPLARKFALMDRTNKRFLTREVGEFINLQSVAEGPPSNIAVDMGSAVRLNITGNAVGPYREQIEQHLRQLIQKNGWKLDENSPIVLGGNLESVTETFDYETTGIFNYGKKTEQITVPYTKYGVSVWKGHSNLFSYSRLSLATKVKSIPAGKTLQQHVAEQSVFRPSVITSIDVPAQLKTKEVFTGFGTTVISEVK